MSKLWGIQIEYGKPPVSCTFEQDVHITHATFKQSGTNVKVYARNGVTGDEHILCNLCGGSTYGILQTPLNLRLSKGKTVTFRIEATYGGKPAAVNLTGYTIES